MPENIKRVERYLKLANKIQNDDDVILKLGAISIYAGIADFWLIQTARLMEQIQLKSQLIQGINPSYQPHEDSYFYGEKVNSSTIITVIRKMLPLEHNDFKITDRTNQAIKKFLNKSKKFLRSRNILLHQIGNKKLTDKEFLEMINYCINQYKNMETSHRELSEILTPYRFSQKELDYFYGNPKKPRS